MATLKIRVIYVDDEPDLLEIAKLFLRIEDGFEIKTTTSTEEALDIVSKGECDVIISDYQMPEIDGIKFLKKVREKFKNIPFILFTGRGREDIAIEAFENGADFYVKKGGEPKAMFAELGMKIKKSFSTELSSFNLGMIIDTLKDSARNGFVDVEKILKLACKSLRAEVAYLAYIEGEPGKEELKIRNHVGIITPEFISMKVPRDYGMGWKVISSGKGIIANNYLKNISTVDHEYFVDDAVKKENVVSAMAVPVSLPTGITGIMYIFTRTDREFFEYDLMIASSFGSIIGMQIDRQKMLQEQEKMTDVLIEANKKLRIITSSTRHAVNNQLTGLNILTELIPKAETDKVKEYCSKMMTIIDKIRSDIDDIKRYQDEDVDNPRWSSIKDLEEYFSKIYPDISFINKAKNLEIYVDQLMAIAIDNLIENAIRHGERVSRITINYEVLPDESIVFIFKDNGIGIKDKDKKDIFKPGIGKNTGMGLYLVKRIFSMASMDIKETGIYGKGARFEISMPVGTFRIT